MKLRENKQNRWGYPEALAQRVTTPSIVPNDSIIVTVMRYVRGFINKIKRVNRKL